METKARELEYVLRGYGGTPPMDVFYALAVPFLALIFIGIKTSATDLGAAMMITLTASLYPFIIFVARIYFNGKNKLISEVTRILVERSEQSRIELVRYTDRKNITEIEKRRPTSDIWPWVFCSSEESGEEIYRMHLTVIQAVSAERILNG